jgi:hypothetical protein
VGAQQHATSAGQPGVRRRSSCLDQSTGNNFDAPRHWQARLALQPSSFMK